MKFKENLPEGCPDNDSCDDALDDVWRFLIEKQPVTEEFESHASRGKVKPSTAKICDCHWSSCSLYQGGDHAAAALKTQMFKRFNYRAQISVPAGSGKWSRNGTHINFWAYDHFDFVASVKKVVKK